MEKSKLLKWINEEITGCEARGEEVREVAMRELLLKIERGYFDGEEEKMPEGYTNSSLRSDVLEIADDIIADIHHGECFYDKKMLDDLHSNLNKMKTLSAIYYVRNKEESLNEDE